VPPLPAISCLGAFQTPVFEPVAGLVIAGVRKPAQKQALGDMMQRNFAIDHVLLALANLRHVGPDGTADHRAELRGVPC
jgi:hypothetical protein